MGMLMSKSLQENFEKQQKFQLEAQRLQMERQLQMQQMMQERMLAMQIARAQDISYYVLTFTFAYTIMGTIVGIQKRNPVVMVPLVPLTFLCHYFYDLSSGEKMVRLRRYAEDILATNPESIALPRGPVTFEEIEERRRKSIRVD